MKSSLGCIFLGFILMKSASAYEIAEFKPNTVDSAHVLSASEVTQINAEIDRVQKEADVMSAVYVVQKLDQVSIDEFAAKVFEKWKLGHHDQNNGLLIVVSIDDRKTRMEVGYGIEADYTDAKTSSIIRNLMNPEFKKQQYALGILAGLNEIIRLKKGSSTLPEVSPSDDSASINVMSEGMPRLKLWLIGMWALPMALSMVGLLLALVMQTESLKKMRGIDSLWVQCFGVQTKGGLFLKAFLTVNPGVFIVAFPLAFQSEPVMAPLFNGLGVLAVLLAVLQSVLFLRRLFSFSYYQAVLERRAQRKARQGTSSSSDSSSSGFGSSDFSSSSDSSSSSSSSDGGSSGGGGSSSDW